MAECSSIHLTPGDVNRVNNVRKRKETFQRGKILKGRTLEMLVRHIYLAKDDLFRRKTLQNRIEFAMKVHASKLAVMK